MNKLVKIKLCCSILCIVIGIIFFVYPIIDGGKNISEELHSYMSGFSAGIIVVGIYTFIRAIKAIKNPLKGQELENEIKDERLNRINNFAMAITFRISVVGEAILSLVCAFSDKLYISEYIGVVLCVQLVVYLVAYYIIKRNN